MLNSTMTKQLDGVQLGLESLESTFDNMKDVHDNYDQFSQSLTSVPALVRNLTELQQENTKLTQMKVAMKNINQVINLKDTVERARKSIEIGNMLLVKQFNFF